MKFGKFIKKFFKEKNNQNNQNNMQNETFIQLGHYIKNDTIDSETQEVIRIIGRDKKTGYYISQDKKRYSIYDIVDNYKFLTPTGVTNKQDKLVGLFDGLGEIEDDEDEIIEEEFSKFEAIEILREEDELRKLMDDNKPYSKFNPPPTKENITIDSEKISKQISTEISNILKSEEIVNLFKTNIKSHISEYKKPEDEFVSGLVEKFNIEKTNQSNEKNNPISKLISLDFNINFEYDLDKIFDAVKLLEIDSSSVIKYIVFKILEKHNISEILYKSLTRKYLEADKSINLTQETQTEKFIKIPEISNEEFTKKVNTVETVLLNSEENDNIKKIDDGITEIDDFINKLIN